MKSVYRFIFFVIIGLLVVPGRAQESGDVIRVLSFNIRYDNPGDSLNSWQYRKNRIAQFIQYHDAGICGLQEALRHQIADLDSLLTGYGWTGVGRDDGREGGEFCPIFYRRDRFLLKDNGTFWLSETPSVAGSRGWDAALPRIVTWCLLFDKLTQKTIMCFNTHFDHMGEKARIMSARLIVEKVSEYTDASPMVITGDFNSADTSAVHAVMKKSGLLDAFSASLRPHYGPNSTWNGFKEIEDGQRIDFIYVNKLVEVRKHAILTDRWDGRFLSDHLPVLGDIVMR
jgi:endonuclease/exonuclease/phosphatase family metal-dependent hydrolase